MAYTYVIINAEKSRFPSSCGGKREITYSLQFDRDHSKEYLAFIKNICYFTLSGGMRGLQLFNISLEF